MENQRIANDLDYLNGTPAEHLIADLADTPEDPQVIGNQPTRSIAEVLD